MENPLTRTFQESLGASPLCLREEIQSLASSFRCGQDIPCLLTLLVGSAGSRMTGLGVPLEENPSVLRTEWAAATQIWIPAGPLGC